MFFIKTRNVKEKQMNSFCVFVALGMEKKRIFVKLISLNSFPDGNLS